NDGNCALYDHNSKNDLFRQNIIENNFQSGLLLFESINHTITQNVIRNCSNIGLAINGKYGNIICFNLIEDNKLGVQVGMGTSQNHIYMNVIRNNTQYNAYSDSYAYSFWDNDTHGHYWGDYETFYPEATYTDGIWSTPYNITNTDSMDEYPLVTPPSIDYNYVNPLSYFDEESSSINGYIGVFGFVGALGVIAGLYQKRQHKIK
ncbi:MAG: hypothetical protein E4G98_06495, partial [Promethearchaeota archaeon]